jgi:hypothetical protein
LKIKKKILEDRELELRPFATKVCECPDLDPLAVRIWQANIYRPFRIWTQHITQCHKVKKNFSIEMMSLLLLLHRREKFSFKYIKMLISFPGHIFFAQLIVVSVGLSQNTGRSFVTESRLVVKPDTDRDLGFK